MSISNTDLPQLIEKLENNTSAIAHVEYRLGYWSKGHWLRHTRVEKVTYNNRLKDRLLKSRLTLLEKISLATTNEIFYTQEERHPVHFKIPA